MTSEHRRNSAEDKEPDDRGRRRLVPFAQQIGRALVVGAGLTLAIACVATWFPNSWWRFWLLQHLRPQIAVASIFLVPMLLWLRCRKTFAVAALPALLNLIVLAPFFFGGSEGESAFSVTHVNVDRDKVGALDYATQFGSDIIFLQEIQPDLDSQLVAAMPEYQIVESNPEPDTRGSAMLVHKEWDGRIVGSEILQLNNYHRPLISATIEVDDHIVTLVSFHAIRPFAKDTIGSHGQEIQRLSAWAVEQEHPVVIVGDFNSTPWSSGVAPLRDEGLVVSMHGHGIQPTWPASAPSLLRIPIDICLHSPELTTTSRSIGEDVGSDHKPVHLEFGFASS